MPRRVFYLGQTGNTGLDRMTEAVIRNNGFQLFDKHYPLGSWANQRHFAFKDVDQLRQFINTGLANETANANDSSVVLASPLNTIFFGIISHRAELDYVEFLVEQANPSLAIKDGTR